MKGTYISVLKTPVYKCLMVYLCPRKHLDLYTCSLNFKMLPNLNVKSLNGIPVFYIIIPSINSLFTNINYIIKHWTLILYTIPNTNNNWILQPFPCRIIFSYCAIYSDKEYAYIGNLYRYTGPYSSLCYHTNTRRI